MRTFDTADNITAFLGGPQTKTKTRKEAIEQARDAEDKKQPPLIGDEGLVPAPAKNLPYDLPFKWNNNPMNPMMPFNKPTIPGPQGQMPQDQLMQVLMTILGGLGGPQNHLTPGLMPVQPGPPTSQQPLLGAIGARL